MPSADAVAFIDALREHAVNRMILVDEWPDWRALVLEKNLRVNAIPDTWIAAQVIGRHEMLVTFDRNFRALLPDRHLLWLDVSA